MEFWSLFNIAFVACVGALSLFFLVSTIAVAAKGKRKCNAFDIILRIISTLMFIAAAAFLLCAVLTVLDNDVLSIKFNEPNIVGAPLVPILVFTGKEIVLPIAELFLIFSTEIGVIIGFALAIVLFLCSLMALTVDCLVANKKEKKQPKTKAKAKAAALTPEQLKRKQELERIKKIGESAVRKTAKVAETESATAQPKETREPEREPEPTQSDWREPEKTPETDNTEFVGIKNNTDSSFDTFDSFDEPTEPDEAAQDNTAEEQESAEREEYPSEPVSESDTVDALEDAEGVPADAVDTDEPIADASEYEEPYADEEATADEPIDEFESALSYVEPDVQESVEQDAEEPYSEPAQDELDTESEQQEEQAENVAADDAAPEYGERKSDGYDDIEPDRGIYIPEMRTIVKPNEDPEPELKPTPAKRSTSTKSKTTTQRSSSAKKTSAKSASGTLASKASKPSGAATAKRNGGRARAATATDTPVEKKLPVTRRYVILDRRNAVNMFGEYLRERNKADKEKLQSSINTIIIE